VITGRRLEVKPDLAALPEGFGKDSRRDHGDRAIKIRRSHTRSDEREHVEAAVDEGAPCFGKKHPACPEHDRCRQHELNPFRNALGNPALDMKTGNQVAHSYEKHWHGEGKTDPEFAGQKTYLGVFRAVLGTDGLWFKPHAADRAVAGMVLFDLGMHRAGVDRLREGGHRCLERHAAFWAIASLVGDDFRMHRARVFAG
jgi:hypothetical protein